MESLPGIKITYEDLLDNPAECALILRKYADNQDRWAGRLLVPRY